MALPFPLSPCLPTIPPPFAVHSAALSRTVPTQLPQATVAVQLSHLLRQGDDVHGLVEGCAVEVALALAVGHVPHL